MQNVAEHIVSGFDEELNMLSTTIAHATAKPIYYKKKSTMMPCVFLPCVTQWPPT